MSIAVLRRVLRLGCLQLRPVFAVSSIFLVWMSLLRVLKLIGNFRVQAVAVEAMGACRSRFGGDESEEDGEVFDDGV